MGDGWGWWMGFGSIWMVGFWAAIIWAVLTLRAWWTCEQDGMAKDEGTALQNLQRRQPAAN